jgi:hypothetical protein
MFFWNPGISFNGGVYYTESRRSFHYFGAPLASSPVQIGRTGETAAQPRFYLKKGLPQRCGTPAVLGFSSVRNNPFTH